MIEFKLADYNLYENQWEWVWDCRESNNYAGHYQNHPLIPGTKVCTKQRLGTVGVVTQVGEETEVETPRRGESDQTVRTYYTEVTVIWTTGSKRGKTEIKQTTDLTNFDSYKTAVLNHLKEIEGYETEAKKFGL